MSGEGLLLEENAERTILLVDDEDNILRALVRLLRRDDYNILTASSAREGLECLKENTVGVILSDQRMPEVSGVEFLSQVKLLYPDTMRMVLSGYTDLKSVTDAINQGAIYKFLTKPWDDELLRENIRKAFNHFSLARENKRLNDELLRLNEVLEKRVIEQNRESKIESQVLNVTQQIINQQPVGVLGISNEHIIVVANDKAHEILSAEPGSLIAMNAREVFEANIRTCYENILTENSGATTQCIDTEKKVIVKKMLTVSGVNGVVITMIPVTEGL
ncbi:MAG: response regulator [Gammaproteobacteria bacterium]